MNPVNDSVTGTAPRILVVDADCACLALLDQWLFEEGLTVVHEETTDRFGAIDLAIVDVPQPRQGGKQAIERVAARHPKTKILALSSAFFPGIEHCPMTARALGVNGVLAKPMAREALMREVRRLLA